MAGKLIILIGMSGSGKSTLAKAMIAKGLADCYYEADMFMIDHAGHYKFEPTRLPYCHNMCASRVNTAMSKGLTVIQSNTNLFRRDLESYFDDAKHYNYNVEIIKMPKYYKSTHNVPARKLDAMKVNFNKIDLSNLPEHVKIVGFPSIT